ncbi:MAG: twin-arginine translocase TatA/TatE family subunit [Bacteroidota bacterium]
MRLLFFDFGAGEIMLVVLAVLLVFGPAKIPEIARNIGKFINEIKRASEDIKTEINREADRIDRSKRLEEYKASLKPDTTESTEETTDKAQ